MARKCVVVANELRTTFFVYERRGAVEMNAPHDPLAGGHRGGFARAVPSSLATQSSAGAMRERHRRLEMMRHV